ncbi:GNAT family N-acetyltransferase [Chitinophaga polysaccharea]|uniref:GNAT family N-acetyltransferase n=1 Tax=Chitinophaga TaxID=79328 RepID=UPI001455B13C|nr:MULTISPECIES: GNAT family protein [Chitinophaga]NLR59361.1 GNAT family N-acetyltransferase [Chitinophaga polysaccharea]NLU91872.1 GNAT family N-acetyltransferase [Chitinophaga sp. Ak27]
MHFHLNTQRLVLRDFLPGDWPALHALYLLPETVRYNPSGYPENEAATRQLVNSWVAQPEAARRGDYTIAIIDPSDQRFVGVISLDLGEDKYARAEVWYKLFPKYWGKGYATEALMGMLTFAFGQLRLHRVECGCSIHNTGSYKVMEKAGMTREGIKRKVLPLEDEWHDAYIYGILAEEFISQRTT